MSLWDDFSQNFTLNDLGRLMMVVGVAFLVIVVVGWVGFDKVSWDVRKVLIGFSIIIALFGAGIWFLNPKDNVIS